MAGSGDAQIWVSRIPATFLSGERLEEYFAQFGDVTGVAIEDDGVACISFAPGVDVQMIVSETHQMDGQEVEVVAMDVPADGGAEERSPKRQRVWSDTDGGAGDAGAAEGEGAPPEDGLGPEGSYAAFEGWGPSGGEGEPPEGGGEPPADGADPEAAADAPREAGAEDGDETPRREEVRRQASHGQPVESYRRGAPWHETSTRDDDRHHGDRRHESYRPERGGGKGGKGVTNVERDRIFVGGWESCGASESDFWKYFDYYGRVKHIFMKPGFCSVTFESEDAVRKVLKDYHTHKIKGRWFEVRAFGTFAATPEARTPTEKDRIFLGALDKRHTEAATLRDYFSQYDEVVNVDLKLDKGFGFVTFRTGKGKQMALWDHDKHRLDGKWFDVQPCVLVDKGGEKGKGDGFKGEKGWGKHGGDKGFAGGKGVFSGFAQGVNRYDSGRGLEKGFPRRDAPGKGGTSRFDSPPALPARAPAPARSPAAALSAPSGWAERNSGGGALPGGAPSSWTASTVQRFLSQKQLEEVGDIFAKHEVTGAVLLTLTEKDLEESLGIRKFGVRRQLMLAIDELRGRPASTGGSFSSSRPVPAQGGAGVASRGSYSSRDNSYSSREFGSARDGAYSSRDSRDWGQSQRDGGYSGRDRERDRDSYARPGAGCFASKGKGKDSWRSRPY